VTTQYIDPTVAGAGTGTIGDPFQDWASVTWTSGNTYLQKRGTTYRKQITIGADNVTIGAYGTGDNPIIRSDLDATPVWTAQANGEYSFPAPSNTFGSSAVVAMLLKDGQPVAKRGSIGSLATGECQSSGTTIYYKPISGDHLTSTFAMLYQDYGFTVGSAVVRDNVTIEDFALMYVYIGFYTGNAGGVEAATNWTLRRVSADWTPRGGIHFVRGDGITIEDSTFSRFTSTGVNFGLSGTSHCNNVTFTNSIIEEGGAWISDTNLEGHALDMVEGCTGLTVTGCIFRNHGASYPSTAYAHAGGAPSHRPDGTLSFDGVSDVVVTGSLFQNNCLAPIQCGDYVDGTVIPGVNQLIQGNVFDGNLKKFTTSDSANATMFTCIQVLGATFVNLRIYGNTYVNNGNGLRLGSEHQRPCLVYAVTTISGTTFDLEVKNNIFGKNDVSSLLTVRIVAAAGTIPGDNISNNVYEDQTDSQWLDSGLVTNYVYVQPNNATSYRVPFAYTFSQYQAASGADANSRYRDIDPRLSDDYLPQHPGMWFAGVAVGGTDYNGVSFASPPTIGAVQYTIPEASTASPTEPARVDYWAIEQEIAEIIRANTSVTIVAVEEEMLFGAESTPWVGVYLDKREVPPARQTLSGGTRTRMQLTFSLWVWCFSLDLQEAIRQRDYNIGVIELALMAHRTLNETVDTSWLAGGRLPSARVRADSGASGGFVSGGEILLVADVVASN